MDVSSDGCVRRVQVGQASKLGVKEGWMIHTVENQAYTSEVMKTFQAAGEDFAVTFRVGFEVDDRE